MTLHHEYAYCSIFRNVPPNQGMIHGAIWEEIAEAWIAPTDRPLTLVGYESALTVRAFVQPLAIGEALIDMPLYLAPNGYVLVPLENTYARAFDAMPKRWRSVVEA